MPVLCVVSLARESGWSSSQRY